MNSIDETGRLPDTLIRLILKHTKYAWAKLSEARIWQFPFMWYKINPQVHKTFWDICVLNLFLMSLQVHFRCISVYSHIKMHLEYPLSSGAWTFGFSQRNHPFLRFHKQWHLDFLIIYLLIDCSISLDSKINVFSYQTYNILHQKKSLPSLRHWNVYQETVATFLVRSARFFSALCCKFHHRERVQDPYIRLGIPESKFASNLPQFPFSKRV